MGCRGQVYIKDQSVYLYTHWGADRLVDVVRKALIKRWRWHDSEYLARIIFDEMVGSNQGSETGFGIGNGKHGDIEELITIDCKNQAITYEGEWGNGKENFEEFIGKEELNY